MTTPSVTPPVAPTRRAPLVLPTVTTGTRTFHVFAIDHIELAAQRELTAGVRRELSEER